MRTLTVGRSTEGKRSTPRLKKLAAPTTTIDLSLKRGEEIPIEQRDPEEVTHLGDQPLAPEGVHAAYPAFEVTPHGLVTAIITERGIVEQAYEKELRRLVQAG